MRWTLTLGFCADFSQISFFVHQRIPKVFASTCMIYKILKMFSNIQGGNRRDANRKYVQADTMQQQ